MRPLTWLLRLFPRRVPYCVAPCREYVRQRMKARRCSVNSLYRVPLGLPFPREACQAGPRRHAHSGLYTQPQ